MMPTRPPWFLYALVAVASAFALPEWDELNPLVEVGYLGLAVAGVMLAAWRGGLHSGLQAAIVAALLGSLLIYWQTGTFGASLAQFGIFMLVALVVSSWRDAPREEPAPVPPRPEPPAYRPLFEAVADAILVADPEGHCLDANRAMAELTGYRHDELRQLHVRSVIAPLRPWTPEERRDFGQEGHWRGELAVRRRDGAVLQLEARLMLLELPSGSVYLTAVRNGAGASEQ
jgi:PAS domain S-box-containing protein